MDDNRLLVLMVGVLGITAILAFVVIMVFYTGDKSIAFAGLSALIGLLIPNLLVLRQGAVAARLADVAAVNSAEAVVKAAEMGKTVDQVHTIVNGDKSKMMAKIAALEVMVDAERRGKIVIPPQA